MKIINCGCCVKETRLQKVWKRLTRKRVELSYTPSEGCSIYFRTFYVIDRRWWRISKNIWENTAIRLWRFFLPKKKIEINFDKIILPRINKEGVYPKLLTEDIIGVQPLRGPISLKPIMIPAFECKNPFSIISEGNRILSMEEIRKVNENR